LKSEAKENETKPKLDHSYQNDWL